MAIKYYGHLLDISHAEMFTYFQYLVGFRNHQGIPVILTDVEEMFSDFGFEVINDLEVSSITFKINNETRTMTWADFIAKIITPKMQDLTKSRRDRVLVSPLRIQQVCGIEVIDWKADVLAAKLKFPFVNDNDYFVYLDFDEQNLVALGYIKGDIHSLKMARRIQFLENLAIDNCLKLVNLIKSSSERLEKQKEKGINSRKKMSTAGIEDAIKLTNQDIADGQVEGTTATAKYNQFLKHLGRSRNNADERMPEHGYDRAKVQKLLN